MRRAALALRPDRRPLLWGSGAIAAGLIAAVGVLIARDVTRAPPASAPAAVASAETIHETARGQPSVVRLADGSVVSLDSDSQVTVRLGARARDLRLERGRARFDVAHDAARPFSVTARGRIVTALGTRFDVKLEPAGEVRVALLEGRVLVGRADRTGAPPVELKPGQELVSHAGAGDEIHRVEAAELEAWREGWIRFEDEPLSEVIAELNRHSADQIIIDDPKLRRLRISGQFKSGDADRFIRHLSLIHAVKAERIGPRKIRIIAR